MVFKMYQMSLKDVDETIVLYAAGLLFDFPQGSRYSKLEKVLHPDVNAKHSYVCYHAETLRLSELSSAIALAPDIVVTRVHSGVNLPTNDYIVEINANRINLEGKTDGKLVDLIAKYISDAKKKSIED